MKEMVNIMFDNNSCYGFIGFGLIGGTIARALRQMYPDSYITAYNYYKNRKHPKLEQALEEKTLSSISSTIEEVSKCDVIFLCAPVLTNINYLRELKPHIRKECLITDVGSVKGDISKVIHELDLDANFVGGHPMTGSEKTGYEHSSASLLRGCYYVLTPTSKVCDEYTKWLETFIKSTGANVCILDCDHHDNVVAGISHGPHVISASLVNSVRKLDKEGTYKTLAAGGFKDITRISSSSPDMWRDICISNKTAILEFLDNFTNELDNAKKAINNGDADEIKAFFENAKQYRDGFIK